MMRLFKGTVVQPPDYRDDRTVEALVEFIKNRVSVDTQVAKMNPKEKAEHKERELLSKDDHPACMMAGFLLVNRYFLRLMMMMMMVLFYKMKYF